LDYFFNKIHLLSYINFIIIINFILLIMKMNDKNY
jgi:hypothetical protein